MEHPKNQTKESASLRFLYHTIPGRLILKGLSARTLSALCGKFLDSRLSKCLIRPFLRKNKIHLEDFCTSEFQCFNDCFTRKIKRSKRPIDKRPDALIAPCDGLLSAYRIHKDMILPVKQSRYSLRSLFAGDEIWKEFEDGICLVYRLCVDHYHRYCYLDNGKKGRNRFISGKLHTVRPIALEAGPVFTENCREYTIMETENFGKVVQMEVGAMLVGKISNHDEACTFRRGQEKGMFLYGGSTILVLLRKDCVHITQKFFRATEQNKEIPVKMGEMIGIKL